MSISDFVSSERNIEVWKLYLREYHQALEWICQKKKSKTNLMELEAQIESIVEKINKTNTLDEKRLSLDELINIMEWKLSRGKFRPLMGVLRRNSNEIIAQASNEAFLAAAHDPLDWEAPMNVLVEKIKGVGEATASAVLSFVFPENYIFMSDEVIEGLLSMKKSHGMDNSHLVEKNVYTRKNYRIIQENARRLLMEINQTKQNNESPLILADLDRCIWTFHVLQMKTSLTSLPSGRIEEGKDVNSSTPRKRRKM